MTTPLQKAAKAVIDRWDSPAWKDQPHTANYIAELRKALDAEIAQAVEPVAFMRPSIEGYDSSYRDANVVVMSKASGATHWDESGWVPLYLHPPQPQATTSLPAEVLEAIRRSGHALVKTKFGYRLNFIGAAIAQGEKP